MRKRLNELDGKTWLQYSFSIWREIRKTPEEVKLKHPAMFPLALTSRLIKIFTHKGDLVLDPFMGCGSTVIAAALEGRKGIGLDLSKEYYEITKRRIYNLGLKKLEKDYIEPEIYNDDARNLLNYVAENSVDLCITSPPYWDILNRPRTADKKQIRKYSDSEKDLGNISDYEKFLNELKEIFYLVYTSLKNGGFCVVVVMDIRKKNKFYPFHSDLANRMVEIGFSFEDIIIWDRQHEYNNMRPLGYPYVFRVNKVHEYILVFQKGGEMITLQKFFECLGYLAAPQRETKLDAEVPERARKRFETKYYNLTGVRPIPDNHNYYILHPCADKWGVELRIYFIANDSIPFPLNKIRVTSRPGTKYNSRINDNNFIWKLIKYGFRLGDSQNLSLIRSKVPSQYISDFNRGLSR